MLIFNGQIVIAHSPRNVDLELAVKNKARIILGPARTGVYLGKLAVRIGDRILAHTLYSSIKGDIEYLKVKNYDRR